jgi:hypothetical protein
MMEYTLEEFVLGNLEARNKENLAHMTEKYHKGDNSERKFSVRLTQFIRQLSDSEKRRIFDGIVGTIAIPALKMSDHFFVRMVERYSALDFRILCARIRQCVKSTLKRKKERAKKDGLVVVVVAPKERMLITLYTRLI